MDNSKPIDNLNEARGKAKGARARATKLSPARRSEIAKEAARKRWALKPAKTVGEYRALQGFKGELDLAGMKLACEVIEGPNGIQRVITETAITNALLGSRSGASKRLKTAAQESGEVLPLFLAPGQLAPFIPEELKEGALAPIDYIDAKGSRTIRAYDASILVLVCTIWLKAREAGALQKQQLDKAQQAEILLRALAQTGIVALIDEVTGYEKVRPQGALQAYLDLIIRKELGAWAKRFPDEFYENIYKLKGWTWPGMGKNRLSVVGHYTKDLVYSRLGPSVLKELQEKTPKNDKGQRSSKLHQWLTDDIGHPMLSQHMHSLIMFQRLAIANNYGWTRFVQMVDQVLPKRDSDPMLPFDEYAPISTERHSEQSPISFQA